jgi:predicted ribosome quality control (RQC) complex YloA/Tae2 family protein
MDAYLFRRFCCVLTSVLRDARLGKIQEPFPNFLTLGLFSPSPFKRKTQLCWRYGKKDAFAFLTTAHTGAYTAPTAPVMRLRKYAADRRIRACVTHFAERQLWLLPEQDRRETHAVAPDGGKTLPWLCLDLRHGASLHFLRSDETPTSEEPRLPALNNLGEACLDWRKWPALTPALRRTLACLDDRERAALLVDLRENNGNVYVYRKQNEPDICAVSAWPLPAGLRGDLEEEESEDVLGMLEKAGQKLLLGLRCATDDKGERRIAKGQSRSRERLQQRLQEEEKRLTAMLGAKQDALLLQEHLWHLPKEIRGGTITVPGGERRSAREIRITPGRTARQEMEALFRTAGRGRRGLAHLARRQAALDEETSAPDQSRHALLPHASHKNVGEAERNRTEGKADLHPLRRLSANLPKGVRAFVSDDGFTLLRGRDAKGNLALRKFAAPHDIWLHVENGPGAHVVIRRSYAGQEVPERTLDQAGTLAACKSWAAEMERAHVVYAEIRHVRAPRKTPVGTVVMDKIFCTRSVATDNSLELRLSIGNNL